MDSYFAGVTGYNTHDTSAGATAMQIPRDIAMVADQSGSHSDAREPRHNDITDINPHYFGPRWASFMGQQGRVADDRWQLRSDDGCWLASTVLQPFMGVQRGGEQHAPGARL